MRAHDIIKRPILTEKSYAGIANKIYTFEVAKDANKVQIRKAIEEIFSVSVESVNTVSVKGHKKSQNTKQGRTVGKTNDYKKAVVTLKADSKPIAFFESLS
jgi:large subunit ribosomal protein L23